VLDALRRQHTSNKLRHRHRRSHEGERFGNATTDEKSARSLLSHGDRGGLSTKGEVADEVTAIALTYLGRICMSKSPGGKEQRDKENGSPQLEKMPSGRRRADHAISPRRSLERPRRGGRKRRGLDLSGKVRKRPDSLVSIIGTRSPFSSEERLQIFFETVEASLTEAEGKGG